MDAERLTTKSQEAVSTAVRRAASEGHPDVEPVHLLVALLDQPEGIAASLLTAVGAQPRVVRDRAEEMLRTLPAAQGSTVGAPQLSRSMLATMKAAGDAAGKIGDEYVSTEHLLVGLAEAGGPVADLLKGMGGKQLPKALVEACSARLGGTSVTPTGPIVPALLFEGIEATLGEKAIP